jgi:hypothetical protein
VLFPNQVIRANDLAKAVVEIAVTGSSEREILGFESRDIRAMAKSQ